jgi:hypothetical protein
MVVHKVSENLHQLMVNGCGRARVLFKGSNMVRIRVYDDGDEFTIAIDHSGGVGSAIFDYMGSYPFNCCKI